MDTTTSTFDLLRQNWSEAYAAYKEIARPDYKLPKGDIEELRLELSEDEVEIFRSTLKGFYSEEFKGKSVHYFRSFIGGLTSDAFHTILSGMAKLIGHRLVR